MQQNKRAEPLFLVIYCIISIIMRVGNSPLPNLPHKLGIGPWGSGVERAQLAMRPMNGSSPAALQMSQRPVSHCCVLGLHNVSFQQLHSNIRMCKSLRRTGNVKLGKLTQPMVRLLW